MTELTLLDAFHALERLEAKIEEVDDEACAGDRHLGERIDDEIAQLERDMIRDHIVDHRREVEEDLDLMRKHCRHLEDTIAALWEELRNLEAALYFATQGDKESAWHCGGAGSDDGNDDVLQQQSNGAGHGRENGHTPAQLTLWANHL